MTTKEQYLQALDKRLKESRSVIDEISTNPDFAHARQQRNIEEEIKRLQAREKAAGEKLRELEQAGGRAWEQLKESIDDALKHLDEAIKSTRSKLKQ